MAIDKNWYQLPENENMETIEDYSEFQGGDITLLGNFPHNVEEEIAFRERNGVLMAGFKLTTGLYVYFEVNLNEQKRYIIPVKDVYALAGHPFDLEDINWNLIPVREYEDDGPLFDMADEI